MVLGAGFSERTYYRARKKLDLIEATVSTKPLIIYIGLREHENQIKALQDNDGNTSAVGNDGNRGNADNDSNTSKGDGHGLAAAEGQGSINKSDSSQYSKTTTTHTPSAAAKSVLGVLPPNAPVASPANSDTIANSATDSRPLIDTARGLLDGTAEIVTE